MEVPIMIAAADKERAGIRMPQEILCASQNEFLKQLIKEGMIGTKGAACDIAVLKDCRTEQAKQVFYF